MVRVSSPPDAERTLDEQPASCMDPCQLSKLRLRAGIGSADDIFLSRIGLPPKAALSATAAWYATVHFRWHRYNILAQIFTKGGYYQLKKLSRVDDIAVLWCREHRGRYMDRSDTTLAHLSGDRGIFMVCLDCELYCGLRDKTSLEAYEANLLGALTSFLVCLNSSPITGCVRPGPRWGSCFSTKRRVVGALTVAEARLPRPRSLSL